MGQSGKHYVRQLRPRNGRLPARIPLVAGAGGGHWRPTSDAGVQGCDELWLGVFFIDDCLVDFAQTRYLPGVLEQGRGYGIWDADIRGEPLEVFPAGDEGWKAARARAEELVRSDPGTTDLLAWIRRERSTRPW
jgi:hypothetical protein